MNWCWWLLLPEVLGTLLASTTAYALRTVSRLGLERELLQRHRGAALDQILSQLDPLVLTATILRVLFNMAIVVSVFAALSGAASHSALLRLLMASLPAGLLILVFSVAIPYAWAGYAGEALIAALWPALRLACAALIPMVWFLRLFDELVRRLADAPSADSPAQEAVESKQEILAAVSEGTAEGAVDEEQKKMIEGIISFRDLQVSQIMTPRTDMITASIHATLEEIRDKVLRDGLARLPVHDGNLDNILGIIYAKDLLSLLGTSQTPQAFNIRQLMRPPLFVPHSKPLRDLLRQFLAQRVHIAIVLDEFGGTAGLITSEDILEEIVGDIADEYEKSSVHTLKRIDPVTVDVDARMNVTDLNRELNLQLPENQEYQTLGGLVINMLGTIPIRGEQVQIEDITITVMESDVRKVKLLRLKLPHGQEGANPPSPSDSGTNQGQSAA